MVQATLSTAMRSHLVPVSYGPEERQDTPLARQFWHKPWSHLVAGDVTVWMPEAGVGVHSRGRMFQGRNIRAPMDGFIACPGSEHPPQRPHLEHVRQHLGITID